MVSLLERDICEHLIYINMSPIKRVFLKKKFIGLYKVF